MLIQTLARAIYSRCHLLLLDDVFSGLDPGTEDTIFTRLLGKRGLLRQLGATVVLVTHAVHRLSYADHIIALTAQGTISEEGKFSELINSEGYVASLVARHKPETDGVGEQPAQLMEDDTLKKDATAIEAVVRPLGDIQAYKYYFSAAGRRNTAAFFCTIMLFAFCERFPGESFPAGKSTNADYR